MSEMMTNNFYLTNVLIQCQVKSYLHFTIEALGPSMHRYRDIKTNRFWHLSSASKPKTGQFAVFQQLSID